MHTYFSISQERKQRKLLCDLHRKRRKKRKEDGYQSSITWYEKKRGSISLLLLEMRKVKEGERQENV